MQSARRSADSGADRARARTFNRIRALRLPSRGVSKPSTSKPPRTRTRSAGIAPILSRAGGRSRSYDPAMALPPPDPSRTAVVTGASSGIGAEIARELARRGLGLTLVARRHELLRTVSAELSETFGVRAEFIAADLTDEDSRSAIADRVAELDLTVEVLVNNAGFTTVGPVHRAERSAELAMVRTDVEAVVDLCTLFLPGMVERRRGAVLNTASTAAYQPLPGQAGYGASKAFVLSYSRAVGSELRGSGVTVTALCPGPVETGFAEVAGMTDEEAGEALPT